MRNEAIKLTGACNTARTSGKDFPTIWREILTTSSLVVGSPVQRMGESGPVLEITLVTGQRIVCGADGFLLR